jgi:hypothetical protein
MRILPAIAKLSFAGFVLAFLIGLTASFGTKFGWWDYKLGLFTLFPWCVYIGLAGLALGIAWAATAAVNNNGAATRWGVLGLVGSAVVVSVPLYDLYSSWNSPPIHDVATDTANPPQFRAILALRSAANATNSPNYNGSAVIQWRGKSVSLAQATHEAYPDIFMNNGFLGTTPTKLYARALQAAQNMGWTIVAQNPNEGRIEATDSSFFFGLTDDIVIRVRPSGLGARLDIRSESRVGEADGGDNAARIRAYFKALAATRS